MKSKYSRAVCVHITCAPLPTYCRQIRRAVCVLTISDVRYPPFPILHIDYNGWLCISSAGRNYVLKNVLNYAQYVKPNP